MTLNRTTLPVNPPMRAAPIDGEPATFEYPPVLGANKDKDRKPIPRTGKPRISMSMNGFIKLVLGIDDEEPLTTIAASRDGMARTDHRQACSD